MQPRHSPFRSRFALILGLSVVFLAVPLATAAQIPGHEPTILPSCASGAGDCTVDDFVQVFVNLANWGLFGLAGITILLVVWGSFSLATSSGNPEKVKGGKDTVFGALLGMVIVLMAYALVNTVVLILTDSEDVANATIFTGTPWETLWFAGEGGNECRSESPYSSTNCGGGTLRQGCGDGPPGTSYGTDVQDLQNALARLGCFDQAADGCFGPETKSAVSAFQQVNGLTVDGVFGKQSMTAMNGDPVSCPVSGGATGNGCCVPADTKTSCVQSTDKATCDQIGGNYLENNADCSNAGNRCSEGCCHAVDGNCYVPSNQIWCEQQNVANPDQYGWSSDFTCGSPPPVPPGLPAVCGNIGKP